MENFLSSTHLLQGLDTARGAFVSFQLLCRRQRVCFWMFTSASRRCRYHHCWPLGHSFRLLVALCGLLFAYFCFSRRPLLFTVI